MAFYQTKGRCSPQPLDHSSSTNFMACQKVSTSVWILRWYTVLLSVNYLFLCSTLESEADDYFYRALIANGVVCALRLHQTIPEFGLTRKRMGLILQEDSAHYLIYTLIFFELEPISAVLVPISFFALVHACSYSRQLMDMHGSDSYFILRKLIDYLARQQAFLFRVTALVEALLFPLIIFLFMCDKIGLSYIFIYYKFLNYRYLSKRNPYSRLVFFEIRMLMEQMIQHGPLIFKLFSPLLRGIIILTCFLGPKVVPNDVSI